MICIIYILYIFYILYIAYKVGMISDKRKAKFKI